jgi:hypothetical protein
VENKDQNPLDYSGGLEGDSLNIGTVHEAPIDVNSLSAAPEGVVLDTQVQKPKSQAGRFLRFARRLDVLLVILLILGSAGTYITLSHVHSHKNIAANGAGSYSDIKIPLGEIVSGKDLSVAGASNVIINGQLQLNDSLTLTPSLQPTGAKPGQIYFDQTTDQLAYYNGSTFVFLTSAPASGIQSLSSVQSLGGASGAIALGNGLSMASGQLSNGGVLSVQGQHGDVTLSAGPGIVLNGTNFSNSGVLSIASGSPNLSVTSDGQGNVTLTVSANGTGTVTSSGGATGTIPLFTGAQNIENSIVTQSGLTVTISGDLSVVTGGLSLSNALTVSNGGTGAASLAGNGVLVGQGTAPVTSIATNTAGLCLLSTTGTPAWGACPTGSGVTSLNTLTGALNIANASAAGSIITIDDASTTNKGIASFNGTNFTATNGAVNTIQNINSGATPTFAGVNTNNITPNAALTLGISAQTALLQGSTTTIKSNGAGNNIVLNSAGTIELQSDTNVTGSLATSANLAVNGGNITSSGTLSIAPSGTLTLGTNSQALTLQGGATSSFHVANGASTTVLGFTSPTANTTLDFPALAAGTYTICTTSGNCAGAGVTLQAAYSNSTSPQIILDASHTGLTIRDNSSPIGGNLLAVQNNSGSATYLAVTSTGVAVAGTATISGNVNAATGALQTNGATRIDNAGNLINIASVTASGSATFQGGSATLGTNAQAGSLILNDGSAHTATLQTATLGQSTTYILPDAGATTATICLATGNCAGSGGGVTTGGGTSNKLAKFTGSQAIGNSSISDDGTNVTVSINVIVQGGDLTLGTASQPASFVLNDGAGHTTTLQAGTATGNLNFILPTNSGTANQCLKQSGTGNQLVWQDCDGGAGGSSATLQTAYNNSTNPEITLSSGVGSLTIRDNSTPLGTNLFQIQNNLGSTTYLAVSVSGISVAGSATATGNVNSTTGTIQTNSTTRVDNSGNLVNIGNITGSGPITIASVGAGNNVTVDGANQFIVQDVSVFNALATFNANVDLGANNIVGTTGNISLTNFTVNGTNGNVTAGTYNGQTISSSANFTGTVAVAGNTTLTGNVAVNGGNITSSGTLNISPSGTLTVGVSGQQLILQGSANTQLTATGGGFTTTVGFSGVPTGAVAYNFDRSAAAGTYTICTTIGNCAGAGGGVTTAGGTTGTLPVFTGSQTLGNSLLSQSGSTVTVNGNLNLVTGNTFQINGAQISSANLSNDANLAKLSASQTFTGNTVAFENGANSTNAFNIQNAGGNRILTVDSSNGQVVLGTASSLNGKLVFSNVSNANTVTIVPGALTANRTLTLPDASGIICTDSGNCAGAGSTLQTSYNFSVGGTTPKIKVNSTLLGVDIQDADTTIAADLFDIRSSNAAGLGSVMFGVGSTGKVSLQNLTNSTAAFRLLTSGGTTVLTGDTTNGQVLLGQSGTLNGTLVFNNATNSNTVTLTAPVATANQSITLPNSSGTICLSSGNCSGAGSSNTLQAAYDAGNSITTSNARDVSFTLADTTTDANFLVNLQCTTGCGSNGRFAVQGSGTDVFSIAPNGGSAIFHNTANTTTAFQVQNAATTAVLDVDTSNGRVGIGTTAPGYALDVAGDINIGSANAYRINGVSVCTSVGCTAASGSSYYIQNQNTAQQTSSNFWISGTGRADTALQAPSLDAPSGTSTLQIAPTNASSIELMHSTFFAGGTNRSFYLQQASVGNNGSNLSIYAGDGNGTNKNGGNLILQGGNSTGTGTAGAVVVQPRSDTTAAFQIQNAAGTAAIFDADSTNKRIGIGTTAPGYALDVVGDVNVSSGSTYRINGVSICSSAGCTPASGSTYYIQNQSAGTQVANAHIQSASDTTNTLVLQSTANQNNGTINQSDLLEFQNSSGGMIAGVTPVGAIWSAPVANLAGVPLTARLFVQANGAASNSAVIRASALGSGSLSDGAILRIQNKDGSADAFDVNGDGSVTAKNLTNSTSAFQVQNASGAGILDIDTTNGRIGLQRTTPATTLDVSGGIQQTGMATATTAGTFAGQWTEIGSCTITAQYQDCMTVLNLLGGSDGGPNENTQATISARVKQQNPMAGVPITNLTLNGSAEWITKNDVKLVTTTNNASQTVVQLWGRITNNYEDWNFTPVMNTGWIGGSNDAPWQWYTYGSFQASLPAGTQTAAVYGDAYANTLTVQSSTNTTSALQVMDSSSNSVLNVDTTNDRVGIGTSTPSRTLDVATNTSVTNAPSLRLLQGGSGDASMEFQSTASATSFYVGQNTSDGSFNINSSTAAKGNGIAFVQSLGNSTGNVAGTSLTQSITATAGNTLVVFASWANTSGSLTCSDTLGNAWTTVITKVDTPHTQVSGICYATNITGGSDTVTTAYTSAPYRRIVVSEYHGLATSSPVDTSASATASSATTAVDAVTSGAATTTTAGDLIFGTAEDDVASNNIAAGTGFTHRFDMDGIDTYIQDKIQYTAGSVASTNTFSNTDGYTALMVAFKAQPGVLSDTFTNSELSLSQTGQATFQNYANSSNAFNIQNSSGAQLLNVNTSSNIITLNGGTTNQINGWTATTSLNTAYSFGGYAQANGYLYAVGGYGATYQTTVQYAKLNVDGSVGTWSTTTALPGARGYVEAAVSNGYIYAIGGTTGGATQSTIYFAKLNPDGTVGAWNSTTSLPVALNAMNVAVSNGYIYIMGGNNGTSNVTNTYYAPLLADGGIGSFTGGTALPASISQSGVVVANGNVYIVGGFNGTSAVNTVYYTSLNPSTGAYGGTWNSASTLPSGMSAYPAVAMNGSIYYFAGSTPYYATVNANGTLGTWTSTGTTIPNGYNGQGAVAVNGYMYVIGGYNGSGQTQVVYASGPRTYVGGALDLVGIYGAQSLENDGMGGSVGGSLTAGNTNVVGTLQVQGQAMFNNGASVNNGLDVSINGPQGYAAQIQNISSGTSAKGLLVQLGIANASRATSNYFVAFGGPGSTIAGKIQGGASAVAYTTSGGDYAEYFLADPNNLPQAGELVSLDGSSDKAVTRATTNGGQLMGVISTNPGFIGNGPICNAYDNDCDSNYQKDNVLVALTGQVPVKVTVANGVINRGDPIGLSSTAGVGQKATTAGRIVGYAETGTTTDGTIQVLIEPGYYSPAADLQGTSSNSDFTDINVSGTAQTGNLKVTGATTLAQLTVTGNATIGGTLSVGGTLILSSMSSAPTGVAANGSMYYDTTKHSIMCYQNNTWASCSSGLRYTNTSVPAAISNTASETVFGKDYVLPVGDCVEGRVYRVTAMGYYSTDASATPFGFKMRLGGTSGSLNGTLLAGGSSAAMPTNASNLAWRLDAQFTCDNNPGANAALEAQGLLTYVTPNGQSNVIGLVNTNNITMDTSDAANPNGMPLQLSAQWGMASGADSITLRQLVVESLGP